MTLVLNDNYYIRNAKIEDSLGVTDLIIAVDIDEYGTPDFTQEDLLEIWADIPIETNTWIVLNPEELIVGYGYLEEVSEGRIDSYVFVHPQYRGNGIGTTLVGIIDERAKFYIAQYEAKGLDYEYNNMVPALNQSAAAILTAHDFQFKRVHSRMTIDLQSERPIPVCSPDIQILPYEEARDAYAVYLAYDESFRETRGYFPKGYREWLQSHEKGYDKSLWVVAYLNDKLVGFSINKVNPEGVFVESLGVVKSARNKGVALAILTAVFNESYKQGMTNVSLWVDANSLTRAYRLYEKAGMQAVFQVATYGKKKKVNLSLNG